MDWGMMQDPNAVMEQAAGQCMLTNRPYLIAPSSDAVESKRQTKNCLETALRLHLEFGTSLTLLIVSLDTLYYS